MMNFDEEICKSWDDGELTEAQMINVLIAKIRELIAEVNRLQDGEQK
jgi:hypothetical protein